MTENCLNSYQLVSRTETAPFALGSVSAIPAAAYPLHSFIFVEVLLWPKEEAIPLHSPSLDQKA